MGVGLTAIGAVLAGGAAAGIGIGGAWWTVMQGTKHLVNGWPDTVIARVTTPTEIVRVRRKDLKEVRFAPLGEHDGSDAWNLRIVTAKAIRDLRGAEAAAAIQQIRPAINRFGASKNEVKIAVQEIEAAGDAGRFFESIARSRRAPLIDFQPELRLALEMSMHEDAERRALEGELDALVTRWREAEEIAAISDDLLLPAGVSDRLRTLAERVGRAAGIA